MELQFGYHTLVLSKAVGNFAAYLSWASFLPLGIGRGKLIGKLNGKGLLPPAAGPGAVVSTVEAASPPLPLPTFWMLPLLLPQLPQPTTVWCRSRLQQQGTRQEQAQNTNVGRCSSQTRAPLQGMKLQFLRQLSAAQHDPSY